MMVVRRHGFLNVLIEFATCQSQFSNKKWTVAFRCVLVTQLQRRHLEIPAESSLVVFWSRGVLVPNAFPR